MKSFTYQIRDEMGVHARPAGILVKTAKQYQSKITLTRGQDSIQMDRLIELMTLAIRQGQTITITAEGDDEDAALRALRAVCLERL